MPNKSVVAIVKGKDPEKMVHEVFALFGGVEAVIRPGTTVILKPNAGHPFPPETSVNTNPDLMAATIKEVRKANPKEIIMAEAAARGCDTEQCFDVAGLRKAAEGAGVDKIIDIKRDKDLIRVPIRDARSAITSVLLPRFLIEAEHLINMPVFKSHVSMVFTGALKNMKGVVQDKVHSDMHNTNLAEAMMDIWSVQRADLQLVDMIRPAEGFGPHSTTPVDFGCIVLGKDPVAVDATCCRMVGLALSDVAYFEPAVARGLGVADENMIEIRGKSIKDVYKKLWFPYLGGFERWPEYNIDATGACSSCQGLLAFTMEKLKSIGEYDKNAGITIALGRKKELPKGAKPGKDLILMGECVRKFKNQGVDCIFVGGCPPGEPWPEWSITDRKNYGSPTDEPGFNTRERMAQEMPQWEAFVKKVQADRAKAQTKDGKKKP